jgi:hypothetical protein
MIVESTATEGAPQQDGRRYVQERHVDDRGHVYEYDWLGDQDVGHVLSARAALLTQQIAARRSAEALVSGTLLPMTKLKFRELFTPAERAAIDGFRAGLESLPDGVMSPETKAAVRTGFVDFDTAQNIVRPFLPQVLQMLGLLVSLHLLTEARMQEIIAAGSANE